MSARPMNGPPNAQPNGVRPGGVPPQQQMGRPGGPPPMRPAGPPPNANTGNLFGSNPLGGGR